MSRASSIWVVVDPHGNIPAAFTVKQELITWLGQQDSVQDWVCLRLPDNPSHNWLSPRQGEKFPAEDLLR